MMSFWQIIARFSILLLVLAIPVGLSAHEIRPAIVDFDLTDEGDYTLKINMNVESWLAGIGEEHSDTSDSPKAREYEQFRKLSSIELKVLFEKRIVQFRRVFKLKSDDQVLESQFQSAVIPETGDMALARDSIITFSGTIPKNARAVTWQFDPGASVFRMPGYNGEEKTALYVAAGTITEPVDLSGAFSSSFLRQFSSYVKVGFDHIIPKGLDHILFVIGLYLLSTRWQALLWQVTAFTFAHTITLGLAMTGVFSLPASIVEPLIAASIVYIAVENMMTDRLNQWRTLVVFVFGLLHGLGFAGVLQEFGLGGSGFIAGLIGFNIGVELGQLAVIAICYLAFGLWFGRKQWYHSRVSVPLSILIAAIGAFWFYERVFQA